MYLCIYVYFYHEGSLRIIIVISTAIINYHNYQNDISFFIKYETLSLNRVIQVFKIVHTCGTFNRSWQIVPGVNYSVTERVFSNVTFGLWLNQVHVTHGLFVRPDCHSVASGVVVVLSGDFEEGVDGDIVHFMVYP